METAGKTPRRERTLRRDEGERLARRPRERAIIEVLLKRAYIERQGKALAATEKGVRLIEVVHPEVKSPAMTGQWESYLQRIHKGSAQLEPFLTGNRRVVRKVVERVGQGVGKAGRQTFAASASSASAERTAPPLPDGRGSERTASEAQRKPVPSHEP